MLVYNNTTNQFNFHDGVAWQQLYIGSQWNVNGSNISYSGGRVGIGTNTPLARMAVDSSLMIDQSNSNQGNLSTGALYFGNDYKVGIARSYLTGSSGRSGLSFFTNNTPRMIIDSTGQVGIGTINPLQALHVIGNTYISSYLGIGSSTPDYAFENLNGYNYMYYGLGIGTIPNNTYLLDIGTGASRFQGDVRFNGIVNPNNALIIGNNATIEGTLTVENGKGIVRSNTATQQKIVRMSGSFGLNSVGVGGFADGGLNYENFSGVPTVTVGQVENGTGDWYKVLAVPFNVTATGCSIRFTNVGSDTNTMTGTWHFTIIGTK